ncbi:MAG: hypothetical protein ACP5D2_00265 [Candidatus Nanoarchaeia archaeon]
MKQITSLAEWMYQHICNISGVESYKNSILRISDPDTLFFRGYDIEISHNPEKREMRIEVEGDNLEAIAQHNELSMDRFRKPEDRSIFKTRSVKQNADHLLITLDMTRVNDYEAITHALYRAGVKPLLKVIYESSHSK